MGPQFSKGGKEEGVRLCQFCNLILQKAIDKERYHKDILEMVTRPNTLNMFALGANIQTAGSITGVFIGAENSAGQWEDLVLPLWPSRSSFGLFLANVNKNVATAQSKFFDQQMQIVCTPLFEVNECGVAIL